jgi:CheY-like chemotaxis protein
MAVEPPQSPPRAEASRILMVDDNHDAAMTLADLLREAGHTVVTAHDGVEALDAARALRPQVAILDIGLPVMDGYEVARHLERTLAPESPVLIALTGYGQPHDIARSREHAFAAHLVKPVDPEQLAVVLAAHRPASDLAT